MKVLKLGTAVVLSSATAILIMARTQGNQTMQGSADDLFRMGEFEQAQKVYSKTLADAPKNYQAILGLGRIALLANRLDEAQKWLARAIELTPDDMSARRLLAMAFYRRDEFLRAAPLFRATGSEAVAKKLESFGSIVPYQIEGKAKISRLKFLHTDPLPLVQMRVNGGEEANFIIDTGGSEIYIDTEFATAVGATQYGSTTGTYGGGLKAETGHGRVDSVILGDFLVRNVPVHILNTRRFAAAAHGKRVDGILGTLLLSHFIATLDYPNGELVLRRKTKEMLEQVQREAKADSNIVVPFWMAGDHYMVARGRVNNSGPLMLLVDTGLAGAGFTAPQSTIKEAGIKLSEENPVEGVGGGGKMKSVLFEVNELSLGAARAQRITGFFGPFPQSLEYAEGFRIAGIISHEFFKPYSLTLDFAGMRLFLKRKPLRGVNPGPDPS